MYLQMTVFAVCGKQDRHDPIAENQLAHVGDLFQRLFHFRALLTAPGSAASP